MDKRDKPERNRGAVDGETKEPGPASISLPKGGGALRGIGEKFSIHPATGSGTLTVPILTSSSRQGFGPDLSLAYDSGAGNGPFGFGWHLMIPSIARRTDKGLPQYRDADESDVFMLSQTEDLVPTMVRDIHGIWAIDEHGRDGYRVRRYRPRVEGPFARIERWTRLTDGDTHWRSISKENVLSVYGFDGASRISDPDDSGRVFSWLLCESYDAKGNAIVYDYVAENDAGVDGSAAHERHRVRGANRYLKSIRYGNRRPLLVDATRPSFRAPQTVRPDFTAAGWMFEVVFDYGEGHYQAALPDADGRVFVQATLAAPAASAWPARVDAFSVYRSGFEIRTIRLCRRVLMFHHFPVELGAPDYLVRTTQFTYDEKAIGSFLGAVVQSGYKRQNDARYLERSFPALDFGYTPSPLEDPAFDGHQVYELDAVSAANLPAGVDEVQYRWVDLDGEGISGALSWNADAWYYKPNLGGGRLGSMACVSVLPSFGARSGRGGTADGSLQLIDLGGDGNLDLVAFSPSAPGFFARTDDGGWDDFRAFSSWPNSKWADPNLRFVDLTGEGLASVLITEDECLTWYPSLAEGGFGAAVRLPLPADEERGPRIAFADAAQSIFLADFSGDGLIDIVRIRNGDVCYWPSLGYGRFGAKITMDNAPVFDRPDQFDPNRLRLADTDGSGTTDILYLGRDAICIFLNEAGNAWSDARVLRQFPASDNQAAIAAVDLLGHGTACLVWSSPLPGDARQPLRYVDLMGGKKPHLLVSACNQLGSETRIEYASSTEFYLADKAAGTPWVTRLPFPVHVVARIDTYDRVGRNRFVSRYSYHHGHFDGVEREFRGFGRVEQLDTEELAALTATGDFPLGDNIDASSHVPPVLTKTWYHTGAWFAGRRVSRQFELEYYREGDPALGEGALTDTQLAAMLLEDTLLPEGLTAIECRQACRALKGSLLRREVYARDEREQSDRPYSVSERNYTIRPLQPQGGNRYAVFLPHPREAIDLHYERKLYMGNRADPRVAHALTLDVDDYGDVLLTANVAYGRRIDDPDPLLTNDDRAEQRKLHATFTRNGFTNPVNEDDAWCAPLASEAQSFELLNVAPVSAEAGITNLFGFGELRDLIDGSAVDELPYEDVDGSGVAGTAPFRRLVEHTRTFYRKNDLSGALALGTLEALALPFDHLKLTFTAGLAAQQYVDSGKLTAAALAAALTDDGGYVHSEGDSHWWAPSRRLFYSPGAGDAPAVELAEAVQHFFLARRYADPFGNVGLVTYDRHDLLIEETLDPAGNRVTSGVRDTTGVLVSSGNDYRVLQPALVMDANRNRSAVAYDTFGIVVGTAFMGKPEDSLGDSLDGFDADLTDAVVATHLADPIANAAAILQHATTRVIYDPLAFVRTQALPSPQPPVVCTLVRESHEADLPAGATTRVQCRFLYSDGLGRAIQKKTQAAPGPLVDGGPTVDPRWVGSGWTIYNNKGKVVRKYEPFFGDTPAFEFGNSVGVSPILFYDPIERVVGNLRPDHSWEKSVPDPWRMETWDQHDTLLVADPKSDSDVGDFFSRLPDANYVPTWYAARAGGDLGPEQQEAASQAAVHGATPAVALADSLGRNFLSIAHNKSLYASAPPGTLPTEEYARTRFVFDIQGNQRAVIDALGRTIIRYDYDLCGQRVSVVSMEAGARWELSDVAGNQIRRWDGRGHVFTTVYDALRRPIARVVRGTDAAKSDPRTLAKDLLFEKIEYGEGQADDIHYNLRGRTWRSSDGAGVETNDSYDFKGNLTRSSRRFVQDYQSIADWAVAQPLEPDTFTNAMAFDAQNRPLTLTAPDGSVASPRYDEAGQLNSLDVNVRGSAVAHFVQRIAYNAKGQRTDIAYGNGATTSFEYDPLTFRLTRATTTRPGGGNGLAAQLFNNTTRVQDLRYTTDAVGNVTRLSDQALATIFYANAQVDPVWRYTYDAIYRLIEAGGREHVAQSAWLSAPSDGNERDFPFAGATQFGDLQALRNYSERYEHDAAGNLTRVNHTAKGGSWTRDYAYEEASLVDAAARSNRLTRTTIGPATVEPYAYDEHGNVIAMPHLSRMAWDFKGQLRLSARQVVNDGTPETTYYLYAATGQRLRKVCERQNGTRRSDRVYLRGSELYRQFDGGGVNVTLARETLHVSETERHIAIVETQIIGGGAPVAVPVSALRYQIGNDLESVTVELDGGAALISYEEYTPYGATSYQAGRSAAEVSLKRYRYIAKERDEETGFSRHGVRYYASWLGRWTSCDPAGLAEGTNLYQYSRGSPCRRKDPDGTQSQDAEQRVPDPLPDNTVAAHGEAEAPARDVETAAQGVEAPASDLPTGEGRAAGDQRGATSSGDQSQTQGASTVDQPPPSGTMPSAGAGRAPSAEAATANQPATESNWFTRITKFTDSHELGLKSILLMVAFVAVALTLVIATARVNRNDPAALRAVQIAVTSGTILWALFLAGRDLFHWKIFGQQGNNDNRPLDIWSTVHTLAGVVMGLWRVPFPIVAVLTVAWEGFEMTVPGFGESEINANRIMDITVAWFGWLVAAGSISVATRQQMPWGFNSRSYTEDRLFGVAVGATRL